MPFQYSFEEKTQMLLIFGECGRDATLAAATYAARFKVVYQSNCYPRYQPSQSVKFS
jgi:hypothetical protein